jgi:hypothetical protein
MSEDKEHKVLRTIEFVYNKGNGDVRWCKVDVVDESVAFIKGLEDGQFKQFSRGKILDGRIIEVINGDVPVKAM